MFYGSVWQFREHHPYEAGQSKYSDVAEVEDSPCRHREKQRKNKGQKDPVCVSVHRRYSHLKALRMNKPMWRLARSLCFTH